MYTNLIKHLVNSEISNWRNYMWCDVVVSNSGKNALNIMGMNNNPWNVW